MPRTEPPRARRADAGVTLVEMLVVLALVGLLAGAAGLGIGAATRGPDAASEAAMLAARMRRASEDALLAVRPVALSWDTGSYRFLALADGAWAPHPVPLLGEARRLPGGLAFPAAGSFAVTADDRPEGGEPLVLRLGRDGAGAAVTWDGATATVAAEGAP